MATADGGFYSHAFVMDNAGTPLYAYEHGEVIGNLAAGYLNAAVMDFTRKVIAVGPGGRSARSAIFSFEGGLAVIGAAY